MCRRRLVADSNHFDNTQKEFQKLKTALELAEMSLPTRRELEAKGAQIDSHKDLPLTEVWCENTLDVLISHGACAGGPCYYARKQEEEGRASWL